MSNAKSANEKNPGRYPQLEEHKLNSWVNVHACTPAKNGISMPLQKEGAFVTKRIIRVSRSRHTQISVVRISLENRL